jgi:probable rRNA maturation factor
MPPSGETILFFTDGVKFSLRHREAVRKWLKKVASSHKRSIASLNYIFVSDEVLLRMNKQFLSHNTLTDIITFPGEKSPKGITGEIYISIDRVRENAGRFDQTFKAELARVMAHGLLHLCGFKDKTEKDKLAMRSQEKKALDLHTI